jgi:hypothetical protein
LAKGRSSSSGSSPSSEIGEEAAEAEERRAAAAAAAAPDAVALDEVDVTDGTVKDGAEAVLVPSPPPLPLAPAMWLVNVGSDMDSRAAWEDARAIAALVAAAEARLSLAAALLLLLLPPPLPLLFIIIGICCAFPSSCICL